MAENKKEITRYQELYLRYIFLFGKAVPLTIKAAITKLVEERGLSLTSILTEKKDYIRTSYNSLYKLLFEDSNQNIGAQIDSWTITTLCDVAFVLTEESNVSYMSFKFILDQWQDLDNYAEVASLNYLLFQLKWKVLSKYLLKLSENTYAEYECKRLLHTFDESEAIRTGFECFEVYESLKLTGDVDKHVKIITDFCLPFHIKAKTEKEKVTLKQNEKQVVQIIQMLTDKVVHSGDTVTLVCELNKDRCHVCWLKDGKKLTKTRNIYIFAENGSHFLIVSKATTEDSGKYTCTYKDMSTSASLIVTEQDVLIQIPLHNVYDGKIREYMRVELSCTTNLHGMTPRWFQNNREIKEDNTNVTILSEGYEYKLIIHHVELSDNGEYMIVFDGVTSKVSITVTGYTQLTVKQQIKHNLYKNWVKGMLGLKNLKLGLESPATQAVKSHHEKILKNLPEALKVVGNCSECNAENLLPLHLKKRCPRTQNKHKCPCSKSSHTRRHCPSNGLCSEIYDMVVSDHRFEDPAMRNTRMVLWKTDPWSVATCYMSSTDYTHTSGYKFKHSSKELDCAQLLSLFVNNKTYLQNTKFGVFDMARRHRNELVHNPNHEISDEELRDYLKDFLAVLEVKNDLNQAVFVEDYPEVNVSVGALKELQHTDIDINTKEELEKMRKEIRDAAMIEAADSFEIAMKQKNEEFQEMQNELLSDRYNHIEKLCRKLDGTEYSGVCNTHGKFNCKFCMENKQSESSGLMKLENDYKEDIEISPMHMESRELGGRVINICTLPGGESLVILEQSTTKINGLWKDVEYSFRLCKLNKAYFPISSQTFEYRPRGICYIGKNKVLSINGHSLEFINVANLRISSHQEINCFLLGLACYDEIIYTCDGNIVLNCCINIIKKLTIKDTLCKLPLMKRDGSCIRPVSKCQLTVSNGGESIYCLRGLDMYMIDSKNGDILFAFDLEYFRSKCTDTLGVPLCMCYIAGGKVIICDDTGHVFKVNVNGNHGVSKILSMQKLSSACYDKTTSTLYVGDESGIHIFEI